jgi:hypothetical protein
VLQRSEFGPHGPIFTILDNLRNFFSRAVGAPLYKKQLTVFLQIFNILRKKEEINFKIGGIG